MRSSAKSVPPATTGWSQPFPTRHPPPAEGVRPATEQTRSPQSESGAERMRARLRYNARCQHAGVLSATCTDRCRAARQPWTASSTMRDRNRLRSRPTTAGTGRTRRRSVCQSCWKQPGPPPQQTPCKFFGTFARFWHIRPNNPLGYITHHEQIGFDTGGGGSVQAAEKFPVFPAGNEFARCS